MLRVFVFDGVFMYILCGGQKSAASLFGIVAHFDIGLKLIYYTSINYLLCGPLLTSPAIYVYYLYSNLVSSPRITAYYVKWYGKSADVW